MTEREFELSRRDLLRYAAQGAALVGTGGLLATDRRRVTRSSATAAMAPRAKRGGTLQAGLSGGSSSDTLDPQNWVNLVDGARVYSLFNPLVDFDLAAHPVLSLADELEASSDAMKWTIRVKPDIEFHNGKTLSADDVLFTFQRIVNPKTPALGAISLKASTSPTRRSSTSTRSRSRASRRSHRWRTSLPPTTSLSCRWAST